MSLVISAPARAQILVRTEGKQRAAVEIELMNPPNTHVTVGIPAQGAIRLECSVSLRMPAGDSQASRERSIVRNI